MVDSKSQDVQEEEGFAPVSYEAWRDLVERDPQNLPFEKKLSTRLEGGIETRPLYTLASRPSVGNEGLPGVAPWIRGASPLPPRGGWDVRQVVDQPRLEEAAAQAQVEISRGATSLQLRFGAEGMEAHGVADLATVLEGVPLEDATIALDAGAGFLEAAESLMAVWAQRGIPDAGARGAFDADPLGTLSATGSLETSEEEALQALGALGASTHGRFPLVTSTLVSTAPYHEAGATEVQELAIALSTGVAYLRALVDAGLSVDEASRQISIRLQVGADVFLEIAKIRAMRWTWGRVLAAAGAKEPAIQVQASTALRMMTSRDPWVNLLRTTTAAFAAANGGASTLIVLPFDAPLGVSDEFARRLGRNIQRILIDETQLHHVQDPGGGSYYLENLTEDLAKKGWETFQSLEGAGGILQALRRGDLQRDIAKEAEAREKLVSTRRMPLTGLSEFPNLKEEPLVRERRQGSHSAGRPSVTPLPRRRVGEAFERLRDVSDSHLAKTGSRPRVFLANLGKVAEHNARATWVMNLLAAGGIEASTNRGFEEGSQAAGAFQASGARIAVVCGTDAAYDRLGVEVAAALKSVGAAKVLLAGRPGEKEDIWRGAGVDGFLHLGQDVQEILVSLLVAAGVAGSEVSR